MKSFILSQRVIQVETVKVADRQIGQEFPTMTVDEVFNTLREMRVHGAGRIARLAAQGLRDFVKTATASTPKDYWGLILQAGEKLKSARPTAVSLPNGVNYVLYGARTAFQAGTSVEEIKQATIDAANDFITSSLDAVRIIGEIGSKRIKNGDIVLTHCNSEAAISVLKKAHDAGKGIKVYCDETRPKFQGHKTAATLAAYGIDTTLIVDSAARLFMDQVDKVVVGSDAIAVNGALVNKVGTSQVALMAKEARVKVMVAAETYKFSFQTFMGDLVEIEQRDTTEIASREWIAQNPKVKIVNPVFDVTPPEYIDLIITEKGIIPPAGVVFMMKELYQYQ